MKIKTGTTLLKASVQSCYKMILTSYTSAYLEQSSKERPYIAVIVNRKTLC